MNETYDNGNANGSSDGNSEKGSHKRSSANGESNNVESNVSRQIGKNRLQYSLLKLFVRSCGQRFRIFVCVCVFEN